jgi:hypothetical protein
MQFVLTGFTPDTGFRVFAFEGIAEDRSRTGFTVRTDLALIRRYGIQVQDLPLLCRGLLERRDETGGEHTFVYTEAEMRLHADQCAAEKDAAQRKKAARRPPVNNLGSAWRGNSGTEDARQPEAAALDIDAKRNSA